MGLLTAFGENVGSSVNPDLGAHGSARCSAQHHCHGVGVGGLRVAGSHVSGSESLASAFGARPS